MNTGSKLIADVLQKQDMIIASNKEMTLMMSEVLVELKKIKNDQKLETIFINCNEAKVVLDQAGLKLPISNFEELYAFKEKVNDFNILKSIVSKLFFSRH